jgi:hypothetical protein
MVGGVGDKSLRWRGYMLYAQYFRIDRETIAK